MPGKLCSKFALIRGAKSSFMQKYWSFTLGNSTLPRDHVKNVLLEYNEHGVSVNIRNLAVISLVCHRIRHLLVNFSVIWSYIDVSWPTWYQRRCLKRACTRLLTVRVKNAVIKSLDRPSRSLSQLIKLADRISELQLQHECIRRRQGCVMGSCEIRVLTHEVFTFILQQTPLPLLRHMNLEECPNDSQPRYWRLEMSHRQWTAIDSIVSPWRHLRTLTVHNELKVWIGLDATLPALQELILQRPCIDRDLIMLRKLLKKTSALQILVISRLTTFTLDTFFSLGWEEPLITETERLLHGFGSPSYKMNIPTLQDIRLCVRCIHIPFLLALLPYPTRQCTIRILGSGQNISSPNTDGQISLHSFREWLFHDGSMQECLGNWTLNTSYNWPNSYLWQARWSPDSNIGVNTSYEVTYSPHENSQGLDRPIKAVYGQLHHLSTKMAFSKLNKEDLESIQEIVIFGTLNADADIESLEWWIEDLRNMCNQPVPEITFCVSYEGEHRTLTQQLREVFDTVPALSRVWKCLEI